MMKKLSMWLTYIASCNVVYILQFLSYTYSLFCVLDPEKYDTSLCKVKAVWNEGKWLLIILLALIVFSSLWNLQWGHVKHNTRIRYRPETDGTLEAVLAVVPYLAMVFTMNIDVYGALVTIVIMFAFGLAIVQTGHIHMCLSFLLRGYHLYICGNVRIITKLSMEGYLIQLDNEPNGINARELTKNIYIC